MSKPALLVMSFICACLMVIIFASSSEISRLNAVVTKDAIIIDSLKSDIEIEQFEKGRYISIVEQVSTVNCKEVKKIIDGE
jgi:hypothetical protein